MGEPSQVDPQLAERFARDVDALVPAGLRLGLAVSGGPDSVALLLLAAAAMPKRIEAATVDHALRPESRSEADFVARLCAGSSVPHSILTATWLEQPTTAVQERARSERYRLLGNWADERGLAAILTGHHLDDQAETVLMRLARGAGAKGLAGMRAVADIPGCSVRVVRPLLGWAHAELQAICTSVGVDPLLDPSNADDRFERVRVRNALADADWLDAPAIAASAAHLADADEALDWASDREWQRAVTVTEQEIGYRASNAPREILRRITVRAIATLASEGRGAELRGREVDQVLAALLSGGTATLRGVQCTGGAEWRFRAAPPRRPL
ncbi:MAG TPA: tRNA lysidine(34) synthetase TilS [Sphingomicrobium sp.]